ncbi:hypothetical protein MACK_003690 [Theileria orientalis]|uniref:Uncharacterized protein n=1 Tax=Theileria orientalis TaxID=68886 RepID=A0A976XI28_THEOR|nr:hypothetical protein MACK_003690 [Theileria orientalis]
MDNVIFDVSKKNKTDYHNLGVLVFDGTHKFNNYESYKHRYSAAKPSKNIKFKIQCINHTVITIDTSGLIDGNYKVTALEFLYRSESNNDPLIFDLFLQPAGRTSSNLGNIEFKYKFREITADGNGSTVQLKSLKQIDELNDNILNQEYKALNSKLEIEINYDKGTHTVKAHKINDSIDACSVNVNVNGPEQLKGIDFVMYTYTFEGGGFVKLEINQTLYILKGFESSNFNDINLENITVYYHIHDGERKFPLFIQFKPKSGKEFGKHGKHNNKCYELESITQKNKDDEPNKFDCTYNTGDSLVNTKTRLQSIYQKENIKNNIEKMIGSNKSPVVAGTILAVFGFIGIPVGVLMYFHTPKIRSMLARIHRRF